MLKYLNTNKGYENFLELLRDEYFIDKSKIIETINKSIETKRKYICITRPRRFGKTSIVDMLGAYYTKTISSNDIFDKLEISKCENYSENLNKYNVIKIDFSELPNEICNYEEYISMIKLTIIKDIKNKYTDIETDEFQSVSRLLEETNDKFIFIIDEWDFIFNRGMFEENHNDFLEFLRGLLKDKTYVALAYMTGILPIKKNSLCSCRRRSRSKHSSGSALNMFEEFTFLKDKKFEEYFGFTEKEVKKLCAINEDMKYEELESWYNGYMTATGLKVYNPRSVVLALANNSCQSYWTNTGAMEEVLQYLKYNTLEVREDVIRMVNGEEIEIEIKKEFRAGQRSPSTKEEIYSAMVILGFLSYYEGLIKIPNKELMLEFEDALKDESFGYVSDLVRNSRNVLKATVNQDTDTIVNVLHDIHNQEVPILKYNDENSLASVVTLTYLAARDTYRVEIEEKSGKGYIDFSFHPRRNRDIPFILELKKNDTVDNALKQIKEKEYYVKFKKEYRDREILLVAICYDFDTKEHTCKIEKI